jgi:hypothetical protein
LGRLESNSNTNNCHPFWRRTALNNAYTQDEINDLQQLWSEQLPNEPMPAREQWELWCRSFSAPCMVTAIHRAHTRLKHQEIRDHVAVLKIVNANARHLAQAAGLWLTREQREAQRQAQGFGVPTEWLVEAQQ